MSEVADFDEEASRRDYKAPYSHNRPIPTIQRYREHRNELDEQYKHVENSQHTEEDGSRAKQAFSSVKAIVKNEGKNDPDGTPYPTSNRNKENPERVPGEHDSGIPGVPGVPGVPVGPTWLQETSLSLPRHFGAAVVLTL